MQPRIPKENFEPGLDFKGYIADFFSAPKPIKEYLCRMYYIHEIAVFGKSAEENLDKIVYELKVKSFFVGDVR